MYGVILWSDPDVRKAVIWCEDGGGYLAYYEAPDESKSTSREFFDAGDYIEFEMVDNLVPLRACNAQTLRSGQCSHVTQPLQANVGVPILAAPDLGQVVELADRRGLNQPLVLTPELNPRG